MAKSHRAHLWRWALALMIVMVIGMAIIMTREKAPRQTAKHPEDEARHPWIVAFSGSDPQETLAGLRGELRGQVDVVSPHWLRFDAEGNLTSEVFSDEVVREAHSQGAKVWPLVAYAGPYGTTAGCPAILCRQEGAFRFAENLANWARERHLDGLVLDVEYLGASVRPHLVMFSAELHGMLRARGLQLWIAAFPQVDFHEAYAVLHDLPGLASVSDGVILMAYDRHGPHTGPGPVAPLMWVRDNALEAMRHVPKDRLILGLPSYGYIWHKRGAGWTTEVLPARRMSQSMEQGQGDGEHATVSGGDAWWDGIRAGRYKALMARDLGLRGVAVWRHGLATSDLWMHLRQALDS